MDFAGSSPLKEATFSGNLPLVRLLLEAGANDSSYPDALLVALLAREHSLAEMLMNVVRSHT